MIIMKLFCRKMEEIEKLKAKESSKLIKAFGVVVLILALVIANSVSVNAFGIGRVNRITNWKQVKIVNQVGDGVRYQITWGQVKNAVGYQVKFYELGEPGGSWYSWTGFTKKTNAHMDFSSLYAIKGKVRAYKVVNGKKVYGKWSKAVKRIVNC